MEITQKGIEIIKKFEGLRTKAYKCSAGVPTIGYGLTFYPSGERVKMGDIITPEQAEKYLVEVLKGFQKQIAPLIKTELNPHQWDALISFTYNVGVGNLKISTLLKKVNANPNDPTIRNEFQRWVYAGGKKLDGLVKRRAEEATIYFLRP